MADLAVVLVSGSSGLIGALIGAASAQIAARRARESDLRKRCVDRALKSADALESAYVEYALQAISSRDDPATTLRAQAAMRSYNQSVTMLPVGWIQQAAENYRSTLVQYYLFYGQPRDRLDSRRVVPTLATMNEKHLALVRKLRAYEKI